MGGVSGLIFQGFVTYYLLPLDTLGVALGSSTGIFVQWLSLGILLRRKVPQLSLFPSHLGKTVFLFLVSTLSMVVFREIFSLPLFVRILLGGTFGAGIYLLLGYLLRHPEVTLLWKRVFPFLR
jgi:ABC-type Fe3+-siderophore transport system permease subunit